MTSWFISCLQKTNFWFHEILSSLPKNIFSFHEKFLMISFGTSLMPLVQRYKWIQHLLMTSLFISCLQKNNFWFHEISFSCVLCFATDDNLDRFFCTCVGLFSLVGRLLGLHILCRTKPYRKVTRTYLFKFWISRQFSFILKKSRR